MKLTREQIEVIVKEELELFMEQNSELLEEGFKDWARKAALGAATIGALGGAPAMAATPPEPKPAATQVMGQFDDPGPQADDIKVTKGDIGQTEVVKRDIKDGIAFVTLKHVESGIEATGKAKIRGSMDMAFRTAGTRARVQIVKQLQQQQSIMWERKRSRFKKKDQDFYSIANKLKSEGRITEEFEVMLCTLTLEEIIGLRLELAAKSVNHKLYGLNIWQSVPNIVREGILKYVYSASRTKGEMASFLGVDKNTLKKLLKQYKITSYFNKQGG